MTKKKTFPYTVEQVKAAYTAKKYAFFDTKQDYNLNLFFIRTSDTYTNKFDDWFGVIYGVDGKETMLTTPATTKPGLNGGNAVLNPKPGGVACIVPGQYRGAYTWIGKGEGWSKYPFDGYFFALQGAIKVYRDGNKDLILDKHTINNADYKTGINIHRMSRSGTEGLDVNNWSEGCSGMEEPHFMKVVPIIEESVKKYGPKFTVTWFHVDDLKK